MSLWDFFRPAPQAEGMKLLRQILNITEQVMTTVNELTASLQDLKAQLEKAKGEVVDKIDALEAALSNTTLPPEAETALADLRQAAQALDDVVPDAPPPAA